MDHGAKENDFHIELDDSGNAILYQFDNELSLIQPDKSNDPNTDAVLINNSTTFPLNVRRDALINEINKLDGVYAYKKPGTLGNIYIRALKDQYDFDISFIKQSGYYGSIENVGVYIRREDIAKYSTINEAMTDMINNINQQDKVIQARAIYDLFDVSFNHPNIIISAHPDNEDDIFYEELDPSGSELNVDFGDVSYNFTQVRDYYTIKTGENIDGNIDYSEEVYLPSNKLEINVRYDISGQDPTWEYYPHEKSHFPLTLDSNKRFTEVSFSNSQWSETTSHLRFNYDAAHRWSEVIYKDCIDNSENCIRYKTHWQVDISFNIDHFKYAHQTNDIWLNNNIAFLDPSFPLEESDLGNGTFETSTNNIGSMNMTDALYNFTTFTFRNCNQTGRTGPSLVTMKSYYNTYQNGNTTNSWVNNIQYLDAYAGQHVWTVPITGNYRIEAYGAAGLGGNNHASTYNTIVKEGGYGAKMSGEFELIKGEKIRILVGQQGTGFNSYGHRPGSGGGGTFVVRSPYNTESSILLIAGGGGGGGQGDYGQPEGGNAYTETHNTYTGNRGYGGNSQGQYSGTGGGFFGNGVGYTTNWGGFGYTNNGAGGDADQWQAADGGFGGGGSAGLIPGGGGGFSGGDTNGTWTTSGYSYGGGSFNSGTNQSNSSMGNGPGRNFDNPKHGFVVISILSRPEPYEKTTTIPEYNLTSNQILCNAVVKNINTIKSFDLTTLKSQKKFVYDAKTWTELFTKSPLSGRDTFILLSMAR